MTNPHLENLIIKDELRELMTRYVRYADGKDWSALAELFVPEGTFTPLDVSGKALTVMQG